MTTNIKQCSKNRGKISPFVFLLIPVVLVIGWYCWSIYDKYQGGIEPPRPQSEPRRQANADVPRGEPGRRDGGREQRGRPSPEQMRERMKEMFEELNLTEEQKQQIEKIQPPTNKEDFRQVRQKMEEILTEEQQEQLRQRMRRGKQGKRGEVMSRLSPEDQQALQARFERRMGRRPRGDREEGRERGDSAR